jgi:prophage regulatory protein
MSDSEEFPVILRKREVSRRVGLSVRQLERLEAAGRFPQRVALGGNSAGWLESEVRAWIAARVAARRPREQNASACESV